MSFEHATVTRGLMLGIALTSITVGIFDVKYYVHLQIVPHISKHHQYWRLFSHQFACANSSDLLLVELLLYNVGVSIERAFGSVKYSSFIVLSTLLTIITTFLSLMMLQLSPSFGHLFNYIPSGPFSVLFSLVYQYMRLVPSAYQFKIFGVDFTDKIWVYAVAAQLALSHVPSTILLALVGLFSGYLYRSDVMQLKSWRVPHRLAKITDHWSTMLLGEGRAARRTNRVLPDVTSRSGSMQADEPEVITTARPSRTPAVRTSRQTASTTNTRSRSADAAVRITPNNENTSGGMMRQWVSELTGGTRPAAGGVGTVRAPSQSEVQTLTAMFPDIGRDVVLGVLQRSPNIQAAAETLLLGAER